MIFYHTFHKKLWDILANNPGMTKIEAMDIIDLPKKIWGYDIWEIYMHSLSVQ